MTILRPEGQLHQVYARSGWSIPCEFESPQDPRLVQIRAKELEKSHPNVRIRSAPEHPYNCVGMIFASRRAWIEIDHIYRLLREDGYRKIPRGKIVEGDVVLYKYGGDPAHVGVIMFIDRGLTNIKVMSKWGEDAEFIHFIEDG